MNKFVAVVLMMYFAVSSQAADLQVWEKIRQASNEDIVFKTAAELCAIGARPTNTPAFGKALRLVDNKARTIGLKNIRHENFAYGKGWSWSECEVKGAETASKPVKAIPLPYSPTANISGVVAYAPTTKTTEEYRKQYGGKLAGKIVLLSELVENTKPAETSKPWTAEDLKRQEQPLDCPPLVDPKPIVPRDAAQRRCFYALAPQSLIDQVYDNYRKFRNDYWKALADEKISGIVIPSSSPGDILASPAIDFRMISDITPVPTAVVSQADYKRLVNLATSKQASLQLKVKSRLYAKSVAGTNIIAEIPGKGPNEVILLGAHLDSWFHGQGATDNAAGVAVALEAARIISRLPKPKRTIRIAFWGGEEQGLLGSKEYTRPLMLKDDVKMYFNLDSGGGKIRGIYAVKTPRFQPLLKKWLKPTGEDTVVLNPKQPVKSDFESFLEKGVPAFEFFQDPIDEDIQHTTADVSSRIYPANLKQAAQIAAWVVYQAANEERLLPR